MKLRLLMTPVQVGAHKVPFPLARVRVSTPGRPLTPRTMLVDTGASATLFPWSMAEDLKIADVLRRSPSVLFRGLEDTQQVGHLFRVDLEFAGKQVLDGVEVYFIRDTTNIAGYAGLLGQHGVFQRVELFQRTGDPEPFFGLRSWPR